MASDALSGAALGGATGATFVDPFQLLWRFVDVVVAMLIYRKNIVSMTTLTVSWPRMPLFVASLDVSRKPFFVTPHNDSAVFGGVENEIAHPCHTLGWSGTESL